MQRPLVLWGVWTLSSVIGSVLGLVPGLALLQAVDTPPAQEFLIGLLFAMLVTVGLGAGLGQALVLRRGWGLSPRRAGLYAASTAVALPLGWIISSALLSAVAIEAMERNEGWVGLPIAVLVTSGIGLGQGLALWGRRGVQVAQWAGVNALAGGAVAGLVRLLPTSYDYWMLLLPVALITAVVSSITGVAMLWFRPDHLTPAVGNVTDG